MLQRSSAAKASSRRPKEEQPHSLLDHELLLVARGSSSRRYWMRENRRCLVHILFLGSEGVMLGEENRVVNMVGRHSVTSFLARKVPLDNHRIFFQPADTGEMANRGLAWRSMSPRNNHHHTPSHHHRPNSPAQLTASPSPSPHSSPRLPRLPHECSPMPNPDKPVSPHSPFPFHSNIT